MAIMGKTPRITILKTIDDIAGLADIHPAIEFGLKAIGSSSVSKEAALIEMVCHLAENLAMFKDRADMTHEGTPGVWKFGSDADPVAVAETVDDEPKEPAKAMLKRVLDLSEIEPSSAEPESSISHNEPKPDITFKDRLKDRLEPHRLPDLSVDVKKKRGWPW
jgi:hypothetical protein